MLNRRNLDLKSSNLTFNEGSKEGEIRFCAFPFNNSLMSYRSSELFSYYRNGIPRPPTLGVTAPRALSVLVEGPLTHFIVRAVITATKGKGK